MNDDDFNDRDDELKELAKYMQNLAVATMLAFIVGSLIMFGAAAIVIGLTSLLGL